MPAAAVPEPYVPIQPALAAGVARDGLVYREWAAGDGLAADVACFWTIDAEERRSQPYPYRIVPDGCIDLVFDLGNGAGAWVYGAFARPVLAHLDGRVALFGVRIRPGRCGALLGPSAGALADAVHDLDGVLGRAGADCYDALHAAADGSARLRIVARRLATWRATRGRADRRAAAVADAIVAAADPRVATLARRLDLSARHLARLCRHATGLGPKRLARVVRAQRALRALHDGRDATPARVAAELGFADQAHLTGELRALAGTTPGAVRRMADFSKTAPPCLG